jgi:hypothetical protein
MVRGGVGHGQGLGLGNARKKPTPAGLPRKYFYQSADFGKNRLDERQILVTVIYIISVN